MEINEQIGIPDTEWGEAVAAVVVLHPTFEVTAAELQDLVRGQLRSTKMPGIIDFRDELPYSPTGKLLRRVLRDELAAGQDDDAGDDAVDDAV